MIRPKIWFFSSALQLGGAESHLVRLANAISGQFDVTVIPNIAGGSYEKLLLESVNILPLFKTSCGSSSLDMLRSVRPLRHLLQTRQCDLICAVQSHAGLTMMRAVSGLESTLSPVTVVCPQLPINREMEALPSILHSIYANLIRRCFSRAASVIALSQGVRTELVNRGIVTADKVIVIPNACIDPRLASWIEQPAPSNFPHIPPSTHLIVACGRLVRQKGFDVLIRALAKLPESVYLVVLGEGPDRYFLHNLASKLGVSGRVSLIGHVENPFACIGKASLFVLSSRFEGFGNVLVEAMACGTPVLSTACDYGPREIITDGQDGVLVSPDNPQELASAIERLLGSPETRRALAMKAKARAERFSAERVGGAYAEHFRMLIRS